MYYLPILKSGIYTPTLWAVIKLRTKTYPNFYDVQAFK